jgi:hypothetical protein
VALALARAMRQLALYETACRIVEERGVSGKERAAIRRARQGA